MAQPEGELRRSVTAQEVNIQPSLDSVILELAREGVDNPDVIDRIRALAVDDQFDFGQIPHIFTIRRLNEDEYVVISCDEPEDRDEGLEIERTIYRQVFQQQLEFVRRLAVETQWPISELLKQYTTVIEMIGFDLMLEEDETAQIDQRRQHLVTALEQLPHPEQIDWTEQAWGLVMDVYKDLETRAQPISPDRYEPRVGGLIYQLSEANATTSGPFQLQPGDRYLNLHFPMKAVELARGAKILSPRAALREVAQFIRQHNITVTAITGASWLMSHPLAERLGFDVTTVSDQPWNEAGYWLQLVDEAGHIKPDVVAFLHEHKRLPYDFSYAKIPIEKFLDNY